MTRKRSREPGPTSVSKLEHLAMCIENAPAKQSGWTVKADKHVSTLTPVRTAVSDLELLQ